MFNIKINEEHKLLLTELKNINLLILTVIDLIFILLSSYYTFNLSIEKLFLEFDLIVCILIFVDLMYEYLTSNKSLKEFFFTDKNIITVISILPIDLLLFRYLMIFRLFRFVRVIRVVRVLHLKNNSSVRYFISNHLFNLLIIILVIYVSISSVLLVVFDSAFDSIEDGFWFTIVTATTVGYGDITPVTPIGKSLSLLTIVAGIIFVSVFTAYLSSIYDENSDEETRKSIREYLQNTKENNDKLHNEIKELKEYVKSLEDKQDQSNTILEEKLDKITDELERINKK